MESFATPYTVIFNDGDQEHDKGVVGIHSCLTFKRFQSMVGQKTGLPCAQLSTVFVCKRTVGGMEKKQKLPINENTNFAIILSQHNSMKEKDCFFLVALKRSKKERRLNKKKIEPETAEDGDSQKKDAEAEEVAGTDENMGQPKPIEGKTAAVQETAQEADRGAEWLPPTDVEDVLPETRRALDPVKYSIREAQQESAWKSCSTLQRLSSGDLKSPATDPLPADTVLQAEVMTREQTAELPSVHGPVSTPALLVSQKSIQGMTSPTSVLEPAQLWFPHQNFGDHTMATPPEKADFTLFGQSARAVDLQALLRDAVMTNMQLNRPKWCRFCAFCKARNMSVSPFHWCVDDQVVSGFRGPNPAGPIGSRAMEHRVAAA